MKENKKEYILNRWYPTLPNDWKPEHDYVYYKEESLMVNKLLMTTHIINFKHLEYPDFWEEVKQPLFVTDDGVEVFEGDSYYTVTKPYFAKTELKAKEMPYENSDFKYFFHESNADEYIWKNKRVFSYQDIIEHAYNNPKYRSFIEKLAKERVSNEGS